MRGAAGAVSSPRYALHRSLRLPGSGTGGDFPLRISRPEAQSDLPSRQLSTPRRLRSDRSGTCRIQSPPCAGGSPWPWPKASSDVRAAQFTSADLRTIPARDAVVLGRVDGFDDDEAQSECDEGPEVLVRFLAAERNSLEALELADELLDAGAGAIERLREERWSVPGG